MPYWFGPMTKAQRHRLMLERFRTLGRMIRGESVEPAPEPLGMAKAQQPIKPRNAYRWARQVKESTPKGVHVKIYLPWPQATRDTRRAPLWFKEPMPGPDCTLKALRGSRAKALNLIADQLPPKKLPKLAKKYGWQA